MTLRNERVLQNSDGSISTLWNIPAWLNRLLFYVVVCLTVIVLLSAGVTDYLNYHFDSFFPRKTYGSGDAALPLRKDQFVSEYGWRDFRAMGSGDMNYYSKSLAAADLAEIKARTAENGKWNFFVGLVRWATFPELAAIVAVIAIAIVLDPQKNRHVTRGQWRIVIVCIGLGVAVVLVVLIRGYVPAILE